MYPSVWIWMPFSYAPICKVVMWRAGEGEVVGGSRSGSIKAKQHLIYSSLMVSSSGSSPGRTTWLMHVSPQASRGSATELLPNWVHAFDIMHFDLVGMSPLEQQQQQQGKISAIAPAATVSPLRPYQLVKLQEQVKFPHCWLRNIHSFILPSILPPVL